MISFRIEDNEAIASFLSGNDSYIPIGEVQYLHTHPLIRPNFITQIQDLIDKVGIKIVQKNLTGRPVEKLESLAIEIGSIIESPTLDDIQARAIALGIRKVYKLCLDLDSKL